MKHRVADVLVAAGDEHVVKLDVLAGGQADGDWCRSSCHVTGVSVRQELVVRAFADEIAAWALPRVKT
jgi:hypothetical protein